MSFGAFSAPSQYEHDTWILTPGQLPVLQDQVELNDLHLLIIKNCFIIDLQKSHPFISNFRFCHLFVFYRFFSKYITITLKYGFFFLCQDIKIQSHFEKISQIWIIFYQRLHLGANAKILLKLRKSKFMKAWYGNTLHRIWQ